MKRVSYIVLSTLLLANTLAFSFNTQNVKASGTIYIRADGSIDPPTAPISSVDNITYTFTDNIYDEIVVERDNIVVDGAGYTLEGPAHTGIDLSERFNVTIENMVITGFNVGIYLSNSVSCKVIGNNIINSYPQSGGEGGVTLHFSSNNSIVGNQISYWGYGLKGGGILFFSSSNNSILGNYLAYNGGIPTLGGGGSITLSQSSSNNKVVGNNIVGYWQLTCGISAVYSSNYNNISENSLDNIRLGFFVISADHNNIFRNNVTAGMQWGMVFSGANYNDIAENSIKDGNSNPDSYGIQLDGSSNNTLVENNIVNNTCGIQLSSSSNRIYHNNFIRNALQAVSDSTDVWDDGYPSGGNYWSDYTGLDQKCGPSQDHPGSDGMGDTSYVIGSVDRDNYPLMNPWTPPAGHNIAVVSVLSSKTVVCQGFSGNATVYAANKGEYSEAFNVTVYYGNGTLTPEQWDVFWSMGDCNRDGYINETDIDIIGANFGWHGPPGANPADINSDGIVDLNDIVICGLHQAYEIWEYFFLSGGTIGTGAVTGMPSGNSTSLTFTWNTAGIAYGNYTVSAYACPVPGETNTTDNTLSTWIIVTISGDINGDQWVNAKDAIILGVAFNSKRGEVRYKPNADINGDDWCNAKDAIIIGKNFNQHW